jgi:2-polyprenyl-6-methoxyphenol hydroxylase-like FAD-dependent oxidoreductase
VQSTALDVGIVGGGFAGNAVGVFLARAGHRVTIYERVAEPAAVGAGILLQPTGLAVLARLGLLEGAVARGAPVGALYCRTARGRTLFDLRYARLATGLAGLGIHRGALFELLFGAAGAAGVRMCAGAEVSALDVSGPRPRVVGEGGGRLGEHDLIVVADGARSRLRAHAAGVRRARPYRWGALWFVGADADRRFAGTLWQVCTGTRRMLGFLPTGLGPSAPTVPSGAPGRGGAPLVSLFWSLRMDTVDDWRRAGLDAWKREVLAAEPRADALLAQITDVDQILTAGYLDVVMDRVHHGRVLFIGDAAHAMSPQLGQGTNLALCDAAALADALAAEATVERALDAYARRRRAHVRFYQFASRWLTPLFQSDQRWLGAVRDGLFPLLAGAASPLHRQMLRTLAGVKRGLLRASLPLAPLPRIGNADRATLEIPPTVNAVDARHLRS